MKRNKFQHHIGSVNQMARRKRYEQYFDPQKTYMMTPHSRSFPKKKSFFQSTKRKNKKKKSKSKRKDVPRMHNSNNRERSSASKHKISKYDRSVNRDYDSPSKDHEELDLILGERPKNKKSSNLAEIVIDKVYERLSKNKLLESISILQEALNSEPHNYDLNYLLGVCHLMSGSYEQAIDIFDQLLQKKPRKNIFLLLSVCYKKIQEYLQTEKILNICLLKYSKYYEAYIYRGKLCLKLKKYQEALNDFEKAISLEPSKQIGYIGMGDCLRLNQKYDEAKGIYTKALNMSKKKSVSILLRRAICNMELKRYDPAFDDISELLILDPENSEALYFKGLIFNKQRMQNEAVICYEQAIKFNTNKKAVTRSIYEIAKIKIEHRDYYEALYTLQRAQFLDIDERVIKKFKLFTSGVTQMMKKNFQDGIGILTELLRQDDKPLNNFLKPLIYSTRAYGYMSLLRFQFAKQDLQLMERQYTLDLPNLYNKFICEGILACKSQKYEQALSFFSKAGKTMPHRLEPNFYKAVTLICFSAKLIPKEDKDKKLTYLQSALKSILKVEKNIENNPSLFLVRGFLYYSLGDLEKALFDFDKCMAESVKQNPLNFYLNGMILGELGKNEEAIDEFKKALNASEQGDQIAQIYLNQAKCMLLVGQISKGFIDLQTYMSHRPSSPDIHIWAGHLLFAIGATEDAAKAYSNINNINNNFEVLFYRAKCYLNSKDVISTISNLKQMLDVQYDSRTFFDYQMLQLLRECSEDTEIDFKYILEKMKEAKQKAHSTGKEKFGSLFKESDYQFYKAVLYFYARDYQKAAKNFDRSLKLTETHMSEIVEKNQDCLEFYKLSYNNLTYNYYEIQYDCAISQIMAGNTLKGLKKIKSINERIPEGQTKNQLELFAHLIEKQIRNQFNKDQKDDEDQADLYPFPFENRLCSIFPQFILPLNAPVRTKLFFCLPAIEKPDIRPRFSEKMFDHISMKTIEIKPEAPWIRRSEQGVIFTDDVIGCDVELSVSSSSSEENDEEEDEDEEFQHEDGFDEHFEQENVSEGGDGPGIMSPQQLKQFFKLENDVEAKLARLNK